VTRNAVVVGLLYAIVWETTIAAIVPGAQALSVRQWSLALAEKMLGAADAARLGLDAAVGLGTGVVALVALAVASTIYAGMRLRTIHLATAE
jgi:ABC-2 type transport system permease protein